MKSRVLILALALSACAKQPVAESPATDIASVESWRAQQPGAAPAADWQPPVAAQFELSNGVPVLLVENHTLPLVTVQVVMAVGRDANPTGKAGLTALTASLLDEGTKTRSGAQLAADVADQGATLSVWGSNDTSGVALDALGGEALAPSLDLLAEVVREPRFDARDFARVKQEGIDHILSKRSDPRDAAYRAFARELYGAEHPYGVPAIGTEASIGAITLDDVKRLYAEQWHTGNATIVVTGDTTQAELEPLLEARFGSWAKAGGARAEVPAPAVPAGTRVVFVEQPGAVQSVIRVGTPAMGRQAADWMAAQLAGTLVGGMFGSPLNMNLREDKGWSYGAYGGFTEERLHGVFGASTSVQADKTAPAVTEILKELEDARREPTEQELALVRDNLTKSLPGHFETNGHTAAAFATLVSLGLGPNGWAEYAEGVVGTEAAAVGAAATTYLDPARMVVVVVGPRAVEIEQDGQKLTVDVVAELEALGYPVTQAK